MNNANLEMMERLLSQICPPKHNWQWTGKLRHQVRTGLTESEAKSLKLQYGGNVEGSEA